MPDRKVVVERGKMYEKQPAPRNVIIEYDKPQIQVDKQVCEEGVIRTDPATYMSTRPCGEMAVVEKITDLPQPNTLSGYQPSYTRSYTPSACTNSGHANITATTVRSKTSLDATTKTAPAVARGPASFVSPWNTTYRTSYTGKGFSSYRN